MVASGSITWEYDLALVGGGAVVLVLAFTFIFLVFSFSVESDARKEHYGKGKKYQNGSEIDKLGFSIQQLCKKNVKSSIQNVNFANEMKK